VNIKIPYGSEEISLSIGRNPVILAVPDRSGAVSSDQAFEGEIARLKGEWDCKKSNLIIINDADRSTPTAKVFDRILTLLKETPKLKILVACGTHSMPKDEEMRAVLGKYYDYFREKIFFHHSKDNESLKYSGKTSRGTEVWLNKLVFECERVLAIGSLEPHYFAGLTGGRKAFLPGIAGYISIEMNHKLALEEGSQPLALAGNPVHEDMDEALNFLDLSRVRSFQMVDVPGKGIVGASYGGIRESFYDLADLAKESFSYDVAEKAEIAVTAAVPPLDKNLYQAQKAVENVVAGVKDGGIIIWVSACFSGIGGTHFFEHLVSRTPDEIIEDVKKNFKLGWQKSGRMARNLKRFKIFLVSQMDTGALSQTGIKGYRDLKSALAAALTEKGADARVLIVPRGSETAVTYRTSGPLSNTA